MSKKETRLHILQTAARLFAGNGFAETSMNDIVRESGLSKGGIYWHFKSKDEMVAAIFDDYFQAQLAALLAFKQGEGTITFRLRSLVEIIGRDLAELGQQVPQPLEFYAQAVHQPDLLDRLAHYFSTYEKHLAELIQQGVEQGEFTAVEPTLAAHILLATIEGLILVHTFSSHDHALSLRLETAVNLYLKGLKAL